RRLTDLFEGRLSLRIGVNTGDVVVGRPREGSSFVTGDAVNMAARLEQAAAPGEILAGERTAAAAGGAFEFGDPATIEAKGKPGGVISRRVLRALSLMRPRGIGGLPSVFVGREPEFAQLTDRYAQVATDGVPHLVAILGDAGVGKTRLARETWTWLSVQSPKPLRRTGRTLSYGQGTTYWPLGEVLKEHFGINEGDAPAAVAARLAAYPYLGLTLGLAGEEDLHPLVARERLHDAWVEFLGKLVRESPLVMLIEDMHWADDDLYDLVDALVAQVEGPLLILITARPELLDRRPAWGGAWGRASSLRLEALPDGDTGRLLGDLLGTEVPSAISDLVVQRAEGNPFFVEELIATFIDRGVLARENGHWAFGELPANFAVPDSVQAVLAARIDLLPDPEKAALQAASVIGRTFWTGPVYELIGGPGADFGLLEEREFVRRRTGSSLPGEREYVIKHALTREVAYASLPKARRARLHAAFGAWLERRAEGRDELASIVAHHYSQAVRPEDVDLAWTGRDEEVRRLRTSAVTWSRRAGALAVKRYEIDDGLALLRQALALEPDAAQQADVWYEIGHASALKYDGEGFVAAMQKALELGAPEEQVYPELAFQTVQRAGMWQRRLDDQLVDGWIERAVTTAPQRTSARVKALVARAYWHDDLTAARAAVEEADRLGDIGLRSDALGALMIALAESDQFLEAEQVGLVRTELLPAVQDPDHVAEALFMRTDILVIVGRLAPARDVAAQLEATVSGLTPHHRLHGTGIRTRLEMAVGGWEALRELAARAEDAVEENVATPCPFNVGTLLNVALGMVHGEDEESALRLEGIAASKAMIGYDRSHAGHRLRLAIARREIGEVRRLLDSVKQEWLTPAAWDLWAAIFDGLALLDDRDRVEAEAPAWVRPDLYVAPFAVRALGTVRGDPTLLADAISRFEAMGLDWHAQETRRHLS
ncbi:MAG: AAA family ATPase, partial [Chloroflexi bacterium]|nr:AAA family ATPase [Chloroflexota bacterium]